MLLSTEMKPSSNSSSVLELISKLMFGFTPIAKMIKSAPTIFLLLSSKLTL